jgi:hypothetical protein
MFECKRALNFLEASPLLGNSIFVRLRRIYLEKVIYFGILIIINSWRLFMSLASSHWLKTFRKAADCLGNLVLNLNKIF